MPLQLTQVAQSVVSDFLTSPLNSASPTLDANVILDNLILAIREDMRNRFDLQYWSTSLFFFLQTLTFVVTHLKWRLRTTRYQESFILFKLLVIHWMKLLASGCILHKHKENMQSTSTSSIICKPIHEKEDVCKKMFPKGHILIPMYWKSNCLQNIKYKCKQKGVVWGDIFNSFSSRRKSETYQYTFDWLSKCLVYKKYSFHLRSEIIRGQTLWVGQHGSLGRRHPGDKVWWKRVRRYWLLRFLQICMICFGVPVYYTLLICQVIP